MSKQENLQAKISVKVDDSELKNFKSKLNSINSDQFKKLKNDSQAYTSSMNSLTGAYQNLNGLVSKFMAFKITQKFLSISKACLNAASDMTELENITKQVFGSMSSEIDLWSKRVGAELGRSTYQIKKATTDVANIFKGYGDFFSTEQIKNMSQDLATLATDMGSFLNISDERANLAITAAITGEAEALKRLGFNLQDTTIKEYALSKGIKKKYESMTQAEKAQLRYEKLMEITSHVQGDAARTINSYANQFKQLEANVTNLAGNIGKSLVPSTNAVLKGINSLISGFNDWLDLKSDVEVLGEALTKKFELKGLVSDFENLTNKTKTLKTGTKEHTEALNKLKDTESKLIDINPEFLGAFNDKFDKIKAVRDMYDKTTKSIYKMMVAEQSEARISKVTKKYGGRLADYTERKSQAEAKLVKFLNSHGVSEENIYEFLKVANSKNSIDNAVKFISGEKTVDKDGALNFLVSNLKLINATLERSQKEFDEKIKEVEENNKSLEKLLGVDKIIKEEEKTGGTGGTGGTGTGENKITGVKNDDRQTKWQSLEQSLGELDSYFNDSKLKPILQNIKNLNDSVTHKQIAKLENLAGILNPSEIIEEKIRIYEANLQNLRELAIGTDDKNLISKIENVKTKIEELKQNLEIEAINQEMEEITKGKPDELKNKLNEKASLIYNQELKDISTQEEAGLITKLEATKLRLQALERQNQVLIENNALEKLASEKMQEQNLKIQESIQTVQEAIKFDEMVASFRLAMGELTDDSFQAIKIENAKKEYEANLKTLVEALQNLPKELQGKINIKTLPQDIAKIQDDKNISDGAKKVANNIGKLYEDTQKAQEKANKEAKDNIKKSLETASNIAKSLGLDELAEGFQNLKGLIDDANKTIEAISSGDWFTAITTGLTSVFKVISGLFKQDDGSKKIKEKYEEAKNKWNEDIIKTNNNLIYAVENLSQDMKNFNKTLIKNIAANTSNANIYQNQKVAEQMANLYLQAFNPLVKTQIQRKAWVDTPWYQLGTTDHWEYGGTETEERQIKKILGITEFKSTEQIREIYKQWKDKQYQGNFKDRGHEGNTFTTEKYWQNELIGSNFGDVLEAMKNFADSVDRNTKQAKNTARFGIMQSMDGLEVTSANQLKEQAQAQIKKLVEASGGKYSDVAGKIEQKLNEIIKDDEVIVSAFNDTRTTLYQKLSGGEDILSSLGDGLQSYFNKIRNNLAKIKYDFEFRDLESGFNKKFLELTKELTRMRLANEKNLDPKFLNFSSLFKQMKDMEKVSNNIRDVVKDLREQAKAQGISDEIIDKMLPLDKVLDKASQISQVLSTAMNAALNTDSFEQFSMSIGDSLYKIVKENLIKAFSESAKFKKLYEDYVNTDEYKKELDKAKTIKDAYDIIQKNLNHFENKLKSEGLSFRETRAHNGEYLGGFSNGAGTINSNLAKATTGVNITINTNIDNKGYLSTEDLTEDLTKKIKDNLNANEKKEA